MRVCSLASGSSGNAVFIESGTTSLLIDAGLPSRVLCERLSHVGALPDALSGILITHEHHDHIAGAVAMAQQYNLPLIADIRTLSAILVTIPPEQKSRMPRTRSEAVGTTWQIGSLTITSFPIPHDAISPCGYLISSEAWRVCLVTDCGSITEGILAHMRQANLVIVEANHDRERLLRGPYPNTLKHRILSPKGHLANDQTAEAIYCLDDSPRWIWLTHLSKINNTPDLARDAVSKRIGERRMRQIRLEITSPGLGPSWDSAQVFEMRY
jgi:phosphoribosyl 1,2-cyclic phosphodiesterase